MDLERFAGPLSIRPLPLTVALLTSSILACEDPGIPQSLHYDGDHLEVWASDGLQACEGTFPYMEAWLSAFRERVGRSDSSVRHTFYWLSPEEFEASPCRDDVAACAFPRSDVIYSSVAPIEHELVHTEIEGSPSSLLREGAAEVFGSAGYYDVTSSASIEDLADERQIPGLDYQTAGRFSRVLIDRFGVDAYLDLYLGLDGVEGLAGLEAGVAEILGADLSSLVADFDQHRTCRQEAWRFYDLECSALPLVPWQDPDRWSTTVDLACDAPDVIGPRSDTVWARRALHIPETDRYTMSIESDDPSAVVTISSCNAACVPADEPMVVMIPAATVTRPTTLELAPGRHWLRMKHSADTDAPVTIRIER
ncbi:hypothetical protein [Paraliomyxa miuraensis]|uniref:hypothetical protein n=1 Tax=Paraliomyxa miuraensis TaxID=376150 RepID=UPI002255BFBE|nr:hypothetical protein [Paraliomyxa miuraensis]MCX4241337.1 hypothetical protein [Paraliomyxa miuraensis]